jgi:hypothetical protein
LHVGEVCLCFVAEGLFVEPFVHICRF